MMLDINLDQLRQGFWNYLPLGAVIGVLMVVEMGMVLGSRYFQVLDSEVPNVAAGASNTRLLGALLSTEYVYPFELAAVVLLVAIVAAVALTFRGPKKTRYTDPAEQIRVKAADRMRIVRMPVEKQD
jgi:NADH-quinone oxidoreductase subunit J